MSRQSVALKDPIQPAAGGEERLFTWLLFSLIVHGVLILALFLMPYLPAPKVTSPPVYTVDLVGGEKIGGNSLGTELTAQAPPQQTAKKAEPAAPAPEVKPEPKKEVKNEKPEKVQKTEKAKVEKPIPLPEKPVAKTPTKKEPVKKEPASEAKTESKADEGALDRVRERIIQSAVERVKSRTEAAQKPSKGGEVLSSGTGEGEGAASLGQGGRGGGVVKSFEFVAYQNRMLSTIKENWAWVGQKTNLKVVVQFGIRENGEIVGLKVVQPSGDPSYDDSVVRAVKKSSPLPPPPENHRKDFADVELTFRPKDLGA